jgi:hypothetical protein
MENKTCHTYHPLCATLIFSLGCVLGTYFGHSAGIKHDIIVISVATLVFYVTQIAQPRLSLSKKKIK